MNYQLRRGRQANSELRVANRASVIPSAARNLLLLFVFPLLAVSYSLLPAFAQAGAKRPFPIRYSLFALFPIAYSRVAHTSRFLRCMRQLRVIRNS